MRPDASMESAVTELVQGLAGAQCSAVLYGSAARGDWDPQRSDVNILLVVDDADPEALRHLGEAIRAWSARGYTPPLLIGRAEWRRATDVFPIEITDMQLAHRVLVGSDPLAGLSVARADLRRALESALRGKLMRLRQGWVRFHDVQPVLGGFAIASCSELLVLFRAAAVLMGRDPGATPESAIEALAGELGPTADAVRTVARHRRDGEWSCPPELFARYLEAVQRAADLVDTTSSGAS